MTVFIRVDGNNAGSRDGLGRTDTETDSGTTGQKKMYSDCETSVSSEKE